MNIKSIIESIRLDLNTVQQRHLVLETEVKGLSLENEQANESLVLVAELLQKSIEALGHLREEKEQLLQKKAIFEGKLSKVGAGYKGSDQQLLSMYASQILKLRSEFEPTQQLLDKNEQLQQVHKERLEKFEELSRVVATNKSFIVSKSLEKQELTDVIQRRLKLIAQLTAIVDVDPALSSAFDNLKLDVNDKNFERVINEVVLSILSSSSFYEKLKDDVGQFEKIIVKLRPLVDEKMLKKAFISFITKNDKLFTIPKDPLPPKELEVYAMMMDEYYPKRDTSQSQYKELHASIEAMRSHGIKINDARVIHLATTLRHQLNDFEDNPKRDEDAEKQEFRAKFLTTLHSHDSEFAKHRHGALRQLLGAIHKYVCTNISLMRKKKPLQPLSFFQKTARETQVENIEADFKKEVGEPKLP